MKHLCILLTFISIQQAAYSQSAEDSVRAVVNNMFVAMRNADTMLLKSCFADSAIMQTIDNRDGKTRINGGSLERFVRQVGQQSQGALDERIVFESVKVDDQLASVWTPYEFYFKGNFSHCGVNSFQLVRIGGEWKIQYLIDTRRKQGCGK